MHAALQSAHGTTLSVQLLLVLLTGLVNSLPTAPNPSSTDPLEKLQDLDFANKIKSGLNNLKGIKIDPRKQIVKEMKLPQPSLPNLKKLRELKNMGAGGPPKEQQKPLSCG
eukprot:COSAG05_NODE_3177_length_2265_cov_8.392428_1_plen_111_part_00